MVETVPKLLTLTAVAEALAVSPHSIRKWVKMGKLRPTRICRRLLFAPADVERFVAESSTTQVR
jgi:excisionase family DNA binding protein